MTGKQTRMLEEVVVTYVNVSSSYLARDTEEKKQSG